MSHERNVLFGLLAVHLGKVAPSCIPAETVAAEDLAQRLLEEGVLSPQDRDLIDAMVDAAMESNGHDAAKTIASFGGHSHIRESLLNTTPIAAASDMKTRMLSVGRSGPVEDGGKGVPETPHRYALLGEHGRGGMGRVLRVEDAFLGREVALKELLPVDGDGSGTDAASAERAAPLVARFLQEARITGQLEHPGIVPVYELGHRADGTLYYTMKLVRGRTLEHALRNCGSLEERMTLLPHFVDLCQAVAYAHSRGVIHRDLKPANVMVGEFGETIVLDWGLSKALGKADIHAGNLAASLQAMQVGDEASLGKTAHGAAIGTPSYMPPEQARGDLDAVDARSDIYSLGAVLYELLSGLPPHTGRTMNEVLAKVIDHEPSPLPSNAPRELAAIARTALNKEPAKRYPSAKALADEVQRFQAGVAVEAYRYSLLERAVRFGRRHRALVLTGAVSLLLLAAVSSIYSLSITRANLELMHSRDSLIVSRDEEAAARQLAEETIEQLQRKNYVSGIRLAESHLARRQVVLAHKRLSEVPRAYRHWEWGYLWQALDTAQQTFGGHNAAVASAAFSPDGKWIVTASYDATAKVWDSATGVERFVLSGHEGWIRSVLFNPDGTRVLTVSEDGTARAWDASTGEPVAELRGHTGPITHAAYHPEGALVATASYDHTARVWDAASGHERFMLEGHSDVVRMALFSPDGSQILTVSEDGTARLWDTESGELRAALEGHTDWIRHGAFSTDGALVVTSSRDTTAKVWDSVTGALVATLAGHGDAVMSAHFDAQGERVVTACWDSVVRVWDVHTAGLITDMRGHSDAVLGAVFLNEEEVLSFSRDATARRWSTRTGDEVMAYWGHRQGILSMTMAPGGTHFATASSDASAKLWSIEGTTDHYILRGHDDFVWGAVFNRDGTLLATASEDGTAITWDGASGAMLAKLTGHQGWVRTVAFSPDSETVATGSSDGTARLWHPRTGASQGVLKGHEGPILWVAFDESGEQVITASDDGTAIIWSRNTATPLVTLAGHGDWVRMASFNADGTRVLTASGDGTARLWDSATGDLVHVLAGHGDAVSGAWFSADGSRVCTVSTDRTARLWHTASGEGIATLEGHTDVVYAAAFSPDGSRIVTGSRDGLARVWDGHAGTPLATLRGHGDAVTTVAFSPDGDRIVTASWDNTTKLWSTVSAEELTTLHGHTHRVRSAVFSPDGTRIASASLDGTACIWAAAPWEDDGTLSVSGLAPPR